MALKKSELYSSLWASCDELRGGMDASQYKDYVLVMLFVKYVSDKYADQPYVQQSDEPHLYLNESGVAHRVSFQTAETVCRDSKHPNS